MLRIEDLHTEVMTSDLCVAQCTSDISHEGDDLSKNSELSKTRFNLDSE